MLNLHFRQRHTKPVPRCLRCLLPRRFRERGYLPLGPPLDPLAPTPPADAPPKVQVPQLLARVEQLYRGAAPPVSNGGVALPSAAEAPASLKQVARRIELQQVIAELMPRAACDGPRAAFHWQHVARGPAASRSAAAAATKDGVVGAHSDVWRSEPVLLRANSASCIVAEEPWVLARRRARGRDCGSGSSSASSASACSGSPETRVQSPPDTRASLSAPAPVAPPPPPVRGRAHERRAAGHAEEQQVLQSLRAILARYSSEERADWNVAEWQYLARLVDRVLFWLYLTFTTASTLLILLFAPLLRLRS